MKFGIPFKPMLLKEVTKPFDSELFLYELKFDGRRAIIHVSPELIKIFSRNGFDVTYLYPELHEIKKLVKQEMIFDGEIVLFEDGIPNFSKLQMRSQTKSTIRIDYFSKNIPVCFMVFDCLYSGSDISNKTLLERKKVLNKFKDMDYFIKVNYVLKEGIKLFKRVKIVNFEGIVAKRIDSLYETDTRSEDWLKIKNLKEETFYVGGYVDKEKIAMVSLDLGEFKNNKLYFVGRVMLSKKHSLYQKILKEKIKKVSPFCDYNDKETTYIKPCYTCKVSYLERTKSNKLRQAVLRD